MSSSISQELSEGFILRMHPLQRILIGAILAIAAYFAFEGKHWDYRIMIVLVWDVFAITYIFFSWLVIVWRSPNFIRKHARVEDGSLVFVFIFILLVSFASMFSVLVLILNKENTGASELAYLLIAILGMTSSWFLMHTLFAFHYAHIYYDNDTDSSKDDGGLNFPDEKEPDYRDFAYFSFVLGMTFQVSDVTISSRVIRRLALFHGLLSFGMNTFVIALTINIIAGLNPAISH